VLIVSASAAAGYHVVQLARCLYTARLATAGAGAGGRRLSRGIACVSFLLDKVQCQCGARLQLTLLLSIYSANSLFPDSRAEGSALSPTVSI